MKNINYLLWLCSLGFLCATSSVFADEATAFRYPFYVGINSGYGSTTWEGLVPSVDNQNTAMVVSTPTSVEEGGVVGGFFIGYELIPFFALEANYMRYPNAKVTFDTDSLYAFDHNGDTDLTTHTETASVMGKIMLVIPRTTVRAYSSAGGAIVHRWDQVNDHRRVTPTFGLGLNYNIVPHIMAELGANYTAGFGEAELNPADDYMPFLYSVFLRIAYRF